MFKQIWNGITWPYRAGVEWSDKRPGIVAVREHLHQFTPEIVRLENTVNVTLKVEGLDLPPQVLVAVEPCANTTAGEMHAYARGVVKGFETCRQLVDDARCRTIHAQNRALKTEHNRQAREAREALAKENEGFGGLTVAPAGV